MTSSAAKPLVTEIHRRVDAARRNQNPRVIDRMPSGWAVMGDAQFLPGYCLLLPDPVVPTLNDLDRAARAQFLLDMTRIGDAVISVCRPLRINYEMLGNLEPALHAHIIPRYAHEPPDLHSKAVWLYPPKFWTDTAHGWDAARHAGLMRDLRHAITQR